MNKTLVIVSLIMVSSEAWSLTDSTLLADQSQINKQIARNFYQDLWFTNNTKNYIKYVADEYRVHDIGDRKGVLEPAIEQKNIADFFWKNGNWKSKYDYQIAEGDLVATRWIATYEPSTLLGKIMIGNGQLPIINVFRIENGKIVEIWNHRHDIDTRQTLRFKLQGLLVGLCLALIPTFFVFMQRRLIKKLKQIERTIHR
jgi:predicted SnoaL-like aldol condensation-catalyzing enzyme